MSKPRVVSMKGLGNQGRFGNQIFQYMFLKNYALKYNLQALVPPWVGDWLFGLRDLPASSSLPPACERRPLGAKGPGSPPEG